VASARRNVDAVYAITFLHQFVQLIENYILRLEEESLRDNYVLIYELLDEVMDNGIVQMTDPKTVSEIVTQKGFALLPQKKSESSVFEGALAWRPDGIKHKKNEVYLDVVERVNLLASSSGNVIKCDILGEVVCKCYLTGMPELKLGLNDRAMLERNSGTRGFGSPPDGLGIGTIDLEDAKFHQCVQMSKFESERLISFVPPDGEFVLMNYRVTVRDDKPPFWLECIVDRQTDSFIEFFIRIRSHFQKQKGANNVEIVIPVPDDVDSTRMKASIGTTKYKPDQCAIVWKIGYFPGGKEFSLNIKLGRPSIKAEDVINEDARRSSAESIFGIKKSIAVHFEIPYFTLSGLQVRYMKIMEKTGYNALPWVRYITKNGHYQTRMPDKCN
jgi:AP-1 complex subunit mu